MGNIKFDDYLEEWEDLDDSEELEFIDSLCQEISEERKDIVGVLNPKRVFELVKAKKIISGALKSKSPDAKIICEYGEIFPELGSITIEGANIDVEDIKALVQTLDFADNFDVYPLTNGKIRVSFGFYGIVNNFKA